MVHGKRALGTVLAACLLAAFSTGLFAAPAIENASVTTASPVPVQNPEHPLDHDAVVFTSPDSERDFSVGAEPQRLFALSKSAREYIDKHDVIRIAIPASAPPLSYFDKQGPDGIYVAFLNALNKRLGNRLQAVPLASPPAGHTLACFKDEGHGCPDAFMGPIHELPRDSMLTSPFLRSTLTVISRSTDEAPDGLSDNLRGKNVVIIDQDPAVAALLDRYSGITILKANTTGDALNMVVSGEADAFLGDRILAEYGVMGLRAENLKLNGTTQEHLFFFGVDPGQPELAEVLNAALATLPRRERENLAALWSSGSTNPLRLTDEEQAWLGAHPSLRMGTIGNWPPFEYMTQGNEYQGVIAEYANWLDTMLDIRLRPEISDNPDDAIDALMRGELDIISCMAWSEDRSSRVLFTRPYLRLPLIVATRRDSPPIAGLADLKGKSVAVARGYMTERILRVDYPGVRVLPVADLSAALELLHSGDVDALFGSLDAITYLIRTNGYSNIVIASTTTHAYDLCFGVRKDMPELVTMIDKALDALPGEQAQMFYDQWIQSRTTTVMDWDMFWRLLTGAAIFMVAILFVVARGNRKLRAQMLERQKAENTLRAVLENLPGALSMCDENLRFQFINQDFSNVYGLDSCQVLGKTLCELYAEMGVADDKMAPAHALEKSLFENMNAGKPLIVEHDVTLKRGTAWYITRHVPLTNAKGHVYGLISLSSDVTSAKLLEQQLNAQLNYIQTLLDTLPNPVLLQDAGGRYSLVNKTLENLTGEDRNILLGKTALDNPFFDAADRAAIQADVERLLREGGSCHKEIRYHTSEMPDGSAQLWLTAFSPYTDSIDGVVSVTADITAHKRLEHQLNKAREEAESASRAKSDFLANMSHEIRTPMNAILGLNHLVRQTKLTEYQADHLQKLDGAAETLLCILNDILDFSKIEAGRLELESVPFPLQQALGTVTTTLSLAASHKNLKTACNIAPDVPAMLRGDPLRLSQVLLNLANNAVKFTESGEIVLTIERMEQTPGTVRLRFTLSDTGIGMSEEQVKRLFHAFSQGDASITRRYGGTGLGLAISRQLVEAMNGDIRVESEPDHGSSFIFTAVFGTVAAETRSAPWATPQNGARANAGGETITGTTSGTGGQGDAPDAADAADAAAQSARETADAAALAGKHILLAEDNEINQLVAEELLHQLGLNVDIASDGQEAIRRAKEGATTPDGNRLPYDIILMDIQMPVLDGLSAARELRREPELRVVPIIAMTAHATQEDRRKTREAGMTDHLTKPIKPTELKAVLLQYLRQ